MDPRLRGDDEIGGMPDLLRGERPSRDNGPLRGKQPKHYSCAPPTPRHSREGGNPGVPAGRIEHDAEKAGSPPSRGWRFGACARTDLQRTDLQ